MKKRLVLVDWIDIVTHAGWESAKKSRQCKPAKAKTIGWLIHRDKKNIVIASTWSHGETNNRTVIPRGCIRRIKEL